jgi:hypothetical protein
MGEVLAVSHAGLLMAEGFIINFPTKTLKNFPLNAALLSRCQFLYLN